MKGLLLRMTMDIVIPELVMFLQALLKIVMMGFSAMVLSLALLAVVIQVLQLAAVHTMCLVLHHVIMFLMGIL